MVIRDHAAQCRFQLQRSLAVELEIFGKTEWGSHMASFNGQPICSNMLCCLSGQL